MNSNDINKCLICNRKRVGKFRVRWHSHFVLNVGLQTTYRFTVCPACRAKRIINDIFLFLMKREGKEYAS